MRISGKTDIGRTRTENQDSFRAGSLPDGSSWGIVCDGMGGGQDGRLASTMAADCLEEQLYLSLQDPLKDEEVCGLLEDSLRLANAEIFARSGGGAVVMGTTAVCAILRRGQLFLAHVGDSRAYLFQQGSLRQLTRDHSMVQELVDKGALTPAQANHHPEKNVITRALGVEEAVEPESLAMPMPRDAILLLCTDGLTNMVRSQRIGDVLSGEDFYEMPGELVSDALLAGGRDNITVLLMQPEDED